MKEVYVELAGAWTKERDERSWEVPKITNHNKE